MDSVAPIEVQLVGGPMDGDSFFMTANASLAPPQQLSYLHIRGEETGFDFYQADPLESADWPEYTGDGTPVRYNYHYVGFASLGQLRLARNPKPEGSSADASDS